MRKDWNSNHACFVSGKIAQEKWRKQSKKLKKKKKRQKEEITEMKDVCVVVVETSPDETAHLINITQCIAAQNSPWEGP